jgi:hypothetical protein
MSQPSECSELAPGSRVRVKHKSWGNCASQGICGGQGLEFIPCDCPTSLVKARTGQTVVLKSALDGRRCCRESN